MALSGLWISVASVLAMFDIKPIQDDQGVDLPPKLEFDDSLTRCVDLLSTFEYLSRFLMFKAILNHSNVAFRPDLTRRGRF